MLNAEAVVYVYTGVLDMRVGFDRVAEKVKAECQRCVMEGGWYVFFSRTRDRVRIFYWDRDGYAMWSKRLEAGSFKVAREDGYQELTAIDLRELLSGTELSRIKFRKDAENGLYSSL
jgi:transposase